MTAVTGALLNSELAVHPFFSQENIDFISNKVTEVLSREFIQKITVPDFSIKKKMVGIMQQRWENISTMNQRTIMAICHEIRLHQANNKKYWHWENQYVGSQMMVDLDAEMVRYDPQSIKLQWKQPTTARFYFT